MKIENLDLSEFRDECPAECAFIELMNELGVYDKDEKQNKS